MRIVGGKLAQPQGVQFFLRHGFANRRVVFGDKMTAFPHLMRDGHRRVE